MQKIFHFPLFLFLLLSGSKASGYKVPAATVEPLAKGFRVSIPGKRQLKQLLHC